MRSWVSGNTFTLDTLSVNFTMITDRARGYWDLYNISLSYLGTINNCTSDSDVSDDDAIDLCSLNKTDSLVVVEQTGYTKAEADRVCTEGYSTCAPVALCWTCYETNFYPRLPRGFPVTTYNAAGLLIPGLKLQPFYRGDGAGNDTVIRR